MNPENKRGQTEGAPSEESRKNESAGGLDESLSLIGVLEKEIQDAEEALAQQEKTDPKDTTVFEKLRERSMYLIKRMTQISMLATLGMVANHKITHSGKVNETRDSKGEISYSHPDKKTEGILNYISGKDSLTAEQETDMIRTVFEVWSKRRGVHIPIGFDKFDLDEIKGFAEDHIREFLRNDSDVMKGNLDKAAIHAKIKHFFSQEYALIPKGYPYNKKLYEALWRVEKESGSPRIRWTVGGRRANIEVSHYNPLTNTVYIQALQPLQIVEELPHAKQFSERPVHTYLEFAHSGIRMAKRKIMEKKSWEDIQAEEYAVPGSFENEAHEKIEQQLRAEIKAILGEGKKTE